MPGPMHGLSIRPANAMDGPAFDAVIGASEPVAWSTLNTPTSRSLVAMNANASPVGFIEARQAGDDIEIIMIATKRASRRQGVATALLQVLIAQTDGTNTRRVILEVAEDNAAAWRLYEQNGFIEIARRKRYYRAGRDGGPCDALLLARGFASEPAA